MVGLFETMLIAPEAPYRKHASASYSAALGDCEDLPLTDGSPWRAEPGLLASQPDHDRFTLTTATLGECRLRDNNDIDELEGGLCIASQLGADGSTAMGAACCQCGGGRPKPTTVGNETALRALADAAILALVMACRERAPPNALRLDGSCVQVNQDSYVASFDGEWPYLWSEQALYAWDGSQLVRGGGDVQVDTKGKGLSLRSCAIRCERDPLCTAFSHSGYGCLYWRNGRCSSDAAAGMRGGADQDSVRSFAPCRDDAACAAAAKANAAEGSAVDQGLSLPVSLPCSSASTATSSVPYREVEAPCGERYAAAFEAQAAAHGDHAAALDANVTAEDAELARVEAAYSVAGAAQILANFLVFLAPWLVAAATLRARKSASVHPFSGAEGLRLPPGTTLFDLMGKTGVALLCVQYANSGIMYFSGLHTASVFGFDAPRLSRALWPPKRGSLNRRTPKP